MRKRMLVCALILAAAAAGAHAAEEASAPELLRVQIIGGLYTVEAPAAWRLEERGADLTAAFSESAGADGTLIIAAPNPAVEDAAAYNRRAAEALLKSFGNGTITKEESTGSGARPTHTVWIAFKAGKKAFLGWSRTMEFDGVAVQAMALATMGKFAAFMKTAEPILETCELDTDMLKENAELLAEVGQKILAGLEKHKE